MKMKLTETVKREVEVDVQFPIYREHDVTPDCALTTIYYTRIDADMKSVEILLHGPNKAEIEIGHRKDLGRAEMDYLLGRGAYALTEKRFRKAFEKAKRLIAKAEAIITGGGESCH